MTVVNTTRRAPLREDDAERALNAIDDQVVRSLVRLCVSQARMRFVRRVGESDIDYEAHLPLESFDMEFFVSVLREAFANPAVIGRILAGETLEAAVGWDV